MDGCITLAALFNKISRIVSLIRPHGDPMTSRDLFNHLQCGLAFSCSSSLGHAPIIHQTLAGYPLPPFVEQTHFHVFCLGRYHFQIIFTN